MPSIWETAYPNCWDDGVTVPVVSREAILDGISDEAALRADGHWEMDPIFHCWVRFRQEFLAARAAAREALVQQQKDAEIALAGCLIALDGALPSQRDGAPYAFSDCGALYVNVCSQARREGEEIQGHRTSREAINAWREAIAAHVASTGGDTLWWRTRPEVRGWLRFGEAQPRWFVFSRLSIGNAADTLENRIQRGAPIPGNLVLVADGMSPEQLASLGYTAIPDDCGYFRKAA